MRRGWGWFVGHREDGVVDPDGAVAPPHVVFFAAVSLVFLLDPVGAAWRRRGTTWGAVGLVATALFALAYLWHLLRGRPLAWGATARARPVTAAPASYVRYAALAALAAVTTSALGDSAASTWVFVAVAGLWTFRAWVAVAIAAVLAVAAELLAHRVPGWDRGAGVGLSIVLAVLAVGGGMLASRRTMDLTEVRRENARLAVQDERNRMARDVHDILGHSLTVITVKAELASRLLDIDPVRAKAEVADLERLAREALADVRGAVEGFREISLSGELARARAALASAGIEARLPRLVDTVDPSLRELYAWTIREGVTNVIRHSGARTCTLVADNAGLRLTDDGGGSSFGPAGPAAGHGLAGLAERAHAAGAVLTARRLAPTGFEIRVDVPASPTGTGPATDPPARRPQGRPTPAGAA